MFQKPFIDRCASLAIVLIDNLFSSMLTRVYYSTCRLTMVCCLSYLRRVRLVDWSSLNRNEQIEVSFILMLTEWRIGYIVLRPILFRGLGRA